MKKSLSIRFQLAAVLCLACTTAAKSQSLVIDGETIADAALYDAAKKEGRIVFYGTYPEIASHAIQSAFTKETGIKVEYLRLTTQALYPRLLSEFATKRLEADMIDLTDLPLIQDLVEKGLLNNPHKTPTFDKLASELREKDGKWYAIYRPPSLITVNTALVRPEDTPTSWLDLLQPKWKGQLSAPAIDVGGSAFSLYSFLRQKVDPAYWTKLGANGLRTYPSIVTTSSNLARGESAVAIGGVDSMVQHISQGAPLKLIIPKEGISTFPVTSGLVTTAKRPNAAKVFLNWLTSKHGGNVVSGSSSYGAHPDSVPPEPAGVRLPPTKDVWNIDLKTWMDTRISYSEEWRQIFQPGR